MTEREAFEAFISAPQFEMPIERFDDRSAWPGSYTELEVDLAWQAWKAALAAQPKTLDEAMAVPRAMAQAYENGYNAALANGPAWHDVPTEPGLWVDGINLRVLRFNDPDIGHIGKGRWLGPLPEDTK